MHTAVIFGVSVLVSEWSTLLDLRAESNVLGQIVMKQTTAAGLLLHT